MEEDQRKINRITDEFFSVFTNKAPRVQRVRHLETLCIERVLIINNTSGTPLIYSLQEFIKPREEMLTNGTLVDFSEHEISHKTDIFQNIAQRFSDYEKSGVLKGKPFASKGKKTLQFIRQKDEWKIASVVWSDLP